MPWLEIYFNSKSLRWSCTTALSDLFTDCLILVLTIWACVAMSTMCNPQVAVLQPAAWQVEQNALLIHTVYADLSTKKKRIERLGFFPPTLRLLLSADWTATIKGCASFERLFNKQLWELNKRKRDVSHSSGNLEHIRQPWPSTAGWGEAIAQLIFAHSPNVITQDKLSSLSGRWQEVNWKSQQRMYQRDRGRNCVRSGQFFVSGSLSWGDL